MAGLGEHERANCNHDGEHRNARSDEAVCSVFDLSPSWIRGVRDCARPLFGGEAVPVYITRRTKIEPGEASPAHKVVKYWFGKTMLPHKGG
jgi:hypothetical protein